FPRLEGTLYELPPPAAIARARFADRDERYRVRIEEGDALFDPIPEGHDVVLMADFIHLFDPAKIQLILKRVREAVAPGARLLLVDRWMNADHTSPVLSALLAATFLLGSGDAANYSPDEAEPWLRATGWRLLEHRPLAGTTSIVIGEAA